MTHKIGNLWNGSTFWLLVDLLLWSTYCIVDVLHKISTILKTQLHRGPCATFPQSTRNLYNAYMYTTSPHIMHNCSTVHTQVLHWRWATSVPRISKLSTEQVEFFHRTYATVPLYIHDISTENAQLHCTSKSVSYFFTKSTQLVNSAITTFYGAYANVLQRVYNFSTEQSQLLHEDNKCQNF